MTGPSYKVPLVDGIGVGPMKGGAVFTMSSGALAVKLRHMRLGSIELMDVSVYRVEEIDPGINAVVVRDFERA